MDGGPVRSLYRRRSGYEDGMELLVRLAPQYLRKMCGPHPTGGGRPRRTTGSAPTLAANIRLIRRRRSSLPNRLKMSRPTAVAMVWAIRTAAACGVTPAASMSQKACAAEALAPSQMGQAFPRRTGRWTVQRRKASSTRKQLDGPASARVAQPSQLRPPPPSTRTTGGCPMWPRLAGSV